MWDFADHLRRKYVSLQGTVHTTGQQTNRSNSKRSGNQQEINEWVCTLSKDTTQEHSAPAAINLKFRSQARQVQRGTAQQSEMSEGIPNQK